MTRAGRSIKPELKSVGSLGGLRAAGEGAGEGCFLFALRFTPQIDANQVPIPELMKSRQPGLRSALTACPRAFKSNHQREIRNEQSIKVSLWYLPCVGREGEGVGRREGGGGGGRGEGGGGGRRWGRREREDHRKSWAEPCPQLLCAELCGREEGAVPGHYDPRSRLGDGVLT